MSKINRLKQAILRPVFQDQKSVHQSTRLTRVLNFLWDRVKWGLPIGAVVFLLYLVTAFEPLELYTRDLRFLLRGYDLATTEVVVVGITKRDVAELGEPPWPRSRYATVIRNLNRAGAEVICLDLFFNDPRDSAEDRELVEATREAGNVFYPVFCPVSLRRYDEEYLPRVDRIRTNFPALTEAAAGVGHINIPPSFDGKYRSVPPFINYQGRNYPALGIAAAMAYVRRTADDEGGRAAELSEIPTTHDGRYLINYHGQKATFDFLNFESVLKGDIQPARVRDKLVFIGQTTLGQVNADDVATPFGQMFGVFVQATMADNILSRDFVFRQGTLSALFMIMGLSLVAAFAFSRKYASVAGTVFIVSICVLGGAAFHLFNKYGYFLEAVPAATVLVANFGVAIRYTLLSSYQAVKQKDVELTSLLQSSSLSAEELTPDNAPAVILDRIGETVGAACVTLHLKRWGSCFFWTPETGSRREVNDVPATTRKQVEAIHGFEAAAGPFFREKAEPFVTHDLEGDDRLSDLPKPQTPMPVRSFLCTPLLAYGELIGTLNIYEKKPSNVCPSSYFSDEDLRLISVLVHQAAVMLENTRLLNELSDKNQQLQDTLAELKSAQDQLVRNEKLSAMGKIASTIVHDMKSPLTAASGYAELLEMTDTGGQPQIQNYTRNIVEQIRQVHGLAQQIVDFVKGDAELHLQRMDARKLADDACSQLKLEFPENGISIQNCVQQGTMVDIDVEKFSRVLLNLGRNAVEAITDEGELVFAGKYAGENSVWLTISDNGPGIPEEIRERLFDEFVTHGKKKGTGLGLAMVRKTVEDHNGTISVESEVGKGTTFTISLPAALQKEGGLNE